MPKNKIKQEAVILAILERFDDIEDLTGKDYMYVRRIILRWADEKGFFKE